MGLPLSEVVLIVMGLMTVAIVVAGLCRSLPIPFTVILVVVGAALSETARHVPLLAPLSEFRLSPDVVFFLFLPALIFESGFTLDARQLIKDLPAVLVLAVPALLISTAIVGFSFWGVFDMNLMVALLFGALISATDPVAVVALFKEIGAPPRLNTLVEGESLLNDATAIVLFTIILALVIGGGDVTGGTVWDAILDFLRVFLGGALVGGIIGMVGSELLYRLKSGVSAILAMSLVMAYASFILAEHTLHVSGVMASASAAVALGVFGVARLRHEATDAISETWELVSLVCNALLFLMIGMSLDVIELLGRIEYIGFAIVLVLMARAATVYTLVPATTRLFKLPRVSLGERHIMWWGGLKGGLAVAIVLSIPDTLPERPLLLDMTLGVVLFTLLINAPTIRPLMSRLGLDKMTADEEAELKHALEDVEREALHQLDDMMDAGVLDADAQSAIAEKLSQTLASKSMSDVPDQARREVFLVAIRAELEALDKLYEAGVVTQYTYLDLRDLLRRDRERAMQEEVQVATTREGSNLFMRIERSLLRWLRERNWAAGLLSRYQGLRMTQHLQHNIAGVLMARAGIAALQKRTGLDAAERDGLTAIYEGRLGRRQNRLAVIRRDFTEFFDSFLLHLSTEVALNVAQLGAKHQVHSGEIGAKAFATMTRQFAAGLEHLPPVTPPQAQLSAANLIERVPLFSGVSAAALEALSARAQTVTFLAGDDVIGEGERGNALYIVMQGEVSVIRLQGETKTHLADLGVGAFFGEAALLGDDVRTATVKAVTPSTLLRLARRDVLELAREHPEVEKSLESVRSARTVE
jgi:CPA1 family monovalent cation:H+ antiporter